MKFNIEVDLDWIEEDGSIDELIKDQVVAKVERQVADALKKSVMEKAEQRIESSVLAICSQEITTRIEELMKETRTATDQYGRVTRANFTLESMLVERIDEAFTKKTLNEEGRAESHSPKYSQVEYMIHRSIPKIVDAKVKELGEKTQKQIEQLVTDKIKTQVADKLTSLIVDNSTALSLRQS